MSDKDTWDFPTFQDRDRGPGEIRGDGGSTFYVCDQTLPFSNAISGVVSFFIGPEAATAADQTGVNHWLHTIGYAFAPGGSGFQIYVKNDPAGTGFIAVRIYDDPNATLRYLYQIGDEDGVSGLKLGKWYQFAFSADATSFQYAMNGSITPLIVGTPTSNPGALNLNAGTERWFFGSGAAWGEANCHNAAAKPVAGWSSLLRGPSAFEGSSLDLSDAAVRARIFDADGNLKHPGENGSLWWNDTYQTAAGFKPDVILPDGSPRMEKGSAGLVFEVRRKTGGFSHCPGGLRKFYE